MLKKITVLFLALFFVFLFTTPAKAAIRGFGSTNNFNSNNFSIVTPVNVKGHDATSSDGTYNGTIRASSVSSNFDVFYRMDFSSEDRERIDKGDIKIEAKMDLAATTSWLGADTYRFKMTAYVNGSWTEIAYKSEEVGTSSTSWTFSPRSIPKNSTALRLNFYTVRSGDNECKFSNVRVYFYDDGDPSVKSFQSADSGTKKTGDSTDFTVTFDEAVNVTGTPRIQMNTGGYANYIGGSGTNTLTFRYTVAEGDETYALNAGTFIDFNGGSIRDRASNNASNSLVNKTNHLVTKNIRIDGVNPTISSITAMGKKASGSISSQLKHSDTVEMSVQFDEPVNVTGTKENIRLLLNNGSYAVCQATGTGIDTLDFLYTVNNNDDDIDTLDITELTGGTIRDIAGNDLVRGIQSISASGIRIDTTPPQVTFSPNQNNTYAKSHSTAVSLSDATQTTSGSGLTGLVYQYVWSKDSNTNHIDWEGALENPATSTINIPIESGSGDYFLHVRAVDIAGNINDVTSGAFYLDNQGPELSFGPDGSGSPSGDYQVQVTIQDEHTDLNLSSVQYQWYKDSIDGNRWNALSVLDGAASVSAVGHGVPNNIDGHGNWKLAVKASDALGNNSLMSSGNFFVDKQPPVLNISPDQSTSSKYHQTYSISISAEDPNGSYASGTISGIWFQWTDNSVTPAMDSPDWQLYTAGFTQGEYNGIKYLHVKATDNSGNTSTRNQLFGFDNTPPEIIFQNNGSELVQGWVTATIALSDTLSGVQSWYYQWTADEEINDSNWKLTPLYDLFLDDVDGDWYLSIKAIDQAGNVSTATSKRFRLDNMPPVGGINIVRKTTNTNKVDIELFATDTNYPDDIEYRISYDEEDTWSEWHTLVTTLEDVTIPDVEGERKVQVQYRDRFHNESVFYTDTVTLDKVPPAAELYYSTVGWTAEDVTVTLMNIRDFYNEEGIQVERDSREVYLVNEDESIFYDEENHTYRYIFKNNGRQNFILRDQAGNETVIEAVVDWIDKTAPQVVFSNNGGGSPAQTVSTAVYASDMVVFEEVVLKEEEPDTLFYYWSTNPQSETADYSGWLEAENGSTITLSSVDGQWYLHIKAMDSLGNTTLLRTNRFVLDNTPPIPSITYNTTHRTANPVTAYISLNEEAAITTPSCGSHFYTFEENGEFTFEFVDTAGNMGTKTVVVDWIDKSLPSANVQYSQTEWTNQNVKVTIDVTGEPKRELTNFQFPADLHYETISNVTLEDLTVVQAVYEIRENGAFSFTVRDWYTQISDSVNVVVNNIDKIPPEGEIFYSETTPTQNDINVTLSTWDNTNRSVQVTPPTEAVVTQVNGSTLYTFAENGVYDFVLEDVSGNKTILTAEIQNIDREPPVGSFTYEPSNWTNMPVTVNLTADEAVEILNNNGRAIYTFYENGTFTFRMRDLAGNIGEATAVVDWIDTILPEGHLIYDVSTRTNQDVEITVETSDNSGQPVEIVPPKGIDIVEEEGITRYFAIQNGVYPFKLVDAAGNERTLTATINNIDKVPPEAEVVYSTTAPINENVEIRLTLSKECVVTAPDGIIERIRGGNTIYEAEENGEYTFILNDLAGNENTVTAVIENIDKEPPTGFVTYNTTELTRGPVIATVHADEAFMVSNNFNSMERVFRENGAYTFIIMDMAGNITHVPATVTNIDNEPPEVYIEYSTTDYTNGNVTATVISEENIIIANNHGQPTFEFRENGAFRFIVTDLLGNETSIFAMVENIDKTPPVISLTSQNRLVVEVSEEGSIPEEISDELSAYTAYDSTDGDLTDFVMTDFTSLDMTKPGQYPVKYTVSDRAGNVANVYREVMVIEKDAFRTFINGKDTKLDQMIFKTSKLNFTVMNQQGEVEIKYKSGYLGKGDMKSMSSSVERETEGYVFRAPAIGYYTFYIQDQERNTDLVRVYIQSINHGEVE